MFIKSMSLTQTYQGITRKELILLNDANQVILLPKRDISPRRPLPKEIKDSLGMKQGPLPFE